jgi:pilus assembly protein TadC
MLHFIQTYGLSLGLTGMATFLACRPVVSRVLADRQDVSQLTEAARERVLSMRSKSFVYWLFEPLLPAIGRHPWTGKLLNLQRLEQSLRSSTQEYALPTDDYAGLLIARGGVAALFALLLGNCCLSLPANLMLTAIAGLLTVLLGARAVHQRAENRRREIRKRLPYVIDLLAMQIHAGSSFRQALGMVAKELRDHPLGLELRRTLSECDRGTPLVDALESLNQRVQSEEIKDFVKAIQNGHRRGTEMSQTLQNLSTQFLSRRTERLETLAGKLQVNIAFPGFLVMGACLLIIIGPIVLQAIYGNELLK